MSAIPISEAKNHQYESHSARECHFALMEWAQDARLYSEAIVRLANQVSESPQPFKISKKAWSLGSEDKFSFPDNAMERRLTQLLQKN